MNKLKIFLTLSQPEVRALRIFLKRFFYNEKYCILLLFIDAHYLSNFLTILVSTVAKKTGRCREVVLADALSWPLPFEIGFNKSQSTDRVQRDKKKWPL